MKSHFRTKLFDLFTRVILTSSARQNVFWHRVSVSNNRHQILMEGELIIHCHWLHILLLSPFISRLHTTHCWLKPSIIDASTVKSRFNYPDGEEARLILASKAVTKSVSYNRNICGSDFEASSLINARTLLIASARLLCRTRGGEENRSWQLNVVRYFIEILIGRSTWIICYVTIEKGTSW